PSAGLAAGERFFWVGTARTNRLMPIGTAIAGLAAAAAAFLTSAPVALMVILAVLIPTVGWLTSHVRVTVSPDEIRAQMAAPFPRRTVAMSSVAAVEAIEVVPVQWGGWGWRLTPKATAL